MTNDTDLVRTILLVVALVIAVPMVMMILAWPMMGMWGGDHMWNGGMWDGSGSAWMWLVLWIPLLVILLAGGYALNRTVGRSGGDRSDRALEELRLAYARGDLTDEEFEQRRSRLQRDE